MADGISEEQVRLVARLGRLKLSDDEVRHFAQQLSAVLGYVSKLNELDVSGVEPMSHAMDMSNVLREDDPGDFPGAGAMLSVEQALANAPHKDEPFFGVVKVLGEGASS